MQEGYVIQTDQSTDYSNMKESLLVHMQLLSTMKLQPKETEIFLGSE